MKVMVLSRLCAALATSLLVSIASAAWAEQADGSAETRDVAYLGATLIDGTGAVIQDSAIVVRGDRIVHAGAIVPLARGTEIVDVSGKWITPGLIDAHVHFMTSGRIYTRPAFIDLTDRVSYEDEIQWIKDHVPDMLRAFMCSGVTGLITMGGPSLDYRTRDLARQTPSAPSVFVGHGVMVQAPEFVARNTIPPWDGEMTIKPTMTEAAGIQHVRDGIEQQADIIKTAVDNRGSLLLGLVQWFWKDINAAIVQEANDNDLPVTSHAHALEIARGLMELGVSSLQHIPADQPVDEAFIELARERDVIVVPTLAIGKRTFVELFNKEFEFLDIEARCAVPGVIDSWYEDLSGHNNDFLAAYAQRTAIAGANAKALYDAGVAIGVGTDTGLMGIAHGPSMHVEMMRLAEAGIPPEYLIQAATMNSARVANKHTEYGSVETGKYADFLVLSANPLEDIGNLQAIEQVVKHGRQFSQSDLLPATQQPD